VHLIRRSLRYVPRREYDHVAKDLKPIYTAIDADAAWQALESFDEKWGRRFPPIVHAWQDAWEHVTPFMAFEADVRRVIYTTDESVKAAGLISGSLVVPFSRACGGAWWLRGCRSPAGMPAKPGSDGLVISVGVRDPRPEGALLAGGGVGG
jgi:Transposase, Mutator family